MGFTNYYKNRFSPAFDSCSSVNHTIFSIHAPQFLKQHSGRSASRAETENSLHQPGAGSLSLLLRTADALEAQVESWLKQFGLTGTQYNALRILRGAGPEGLPCREIGERMITHDPDITRLLDRLEDRGFVERARDKNDRRVIYGKSLQPG